MHLYFWWDVSYISFQVQDSLIKYQIYLKSIHGPIDVVLLTKPSVSSVPVVLPIPPPEEILQSSKLAITTSDETESSAPHCQAAANAKNSTKSRQTPMEDMQPPYKLPCIKREPNRTGASKCEYLVCVFVKRKR